MQTLKADWLLDPFLMKLADVIGPDRLRFVGGCVRDTLLERGVTDVDAATSLLPHDTMKVLEDAGVRVVPTGIEHGTVTAVGADRSVEITTLRRDVKTDGRHAEVAFTHDWLEDASRRDFTMNALYVDIEGKLYDPLDGMQDIQSECIRFIGEPAARIKEDALRILRFFRFHAVLGQHECDAKGLKACTQHVDLLKSLSAERVRDELMKIFKVPECYEVIQNMISAGVFEVLSLPLSLDRYRRITKHIEMSGGNVRPSFKLFYCLEPKPGVADYCLQLRLPGAVKKLITNFREVIENPQPTTDHDVHILLYRHGSEAVQQAAAADSWPESLLAIAMNWQVPQMPVQGRDVMALGILPGPEIGKILSQLEDIWVLSEFQLSKSDLIKRIKPE